jgi:MFS transporter, DHA2 family, multidrug resistance protein
MTAPTGARSQGDPHKYLIALAVILASLMQVIDTSIINVAIPSMMGELGASIDEIAWVSTGYILASVIVIPMTGWLAGLFGRKRYFTGSILLFTIASVFCGAAHSLGALIFWRIVQGIGGGALLATSQAIIYEAFPKEEIGTGMALFGLGVMVGPTLGPTLGGWITDNFSWPWIFYINVPVGLIAAAMVVAYVHDSKHQLQVRTIDYAGIILLALSVGAMQYMFEHGQSEDWFDSALITWLAIISVGGTIALVWRELTTPEPVIDLRVLRHREMWIGVIIGVMFGVGLFGSVFVLPLFLQGMLHMTAQQTGMIILPGSIATAVSMAVIGRLGTKIDARLVVTVGVGLFCVSMWQLSHITAEAGAHDFYWPLIWRGLGLGMMFVPLTNIALADLEPRELAQGTALYNFFRQLGGSFGIALIATLLTHYTAQARAVLTEHVTSYDPMSLARVSALTRGFVSRGADAATAGRMALTAIDRQILGQANVIAFGKVYLLSGAVLLATLPLLAFVRKVKPEGAVSVHAD